MEEAVPERRVEEYDDSAEDYEDDYARRGRWSTPREVEPADEDRRGS